MWVGQGEGEHEGGKSPRSRIFHSCSLPLRLAIKPLGVQLCGQRCTLQTNVAVLMFHLYRLPNSAPATKILPVDPPTACEDPDTLASEAYKQNARGVPEWTKCGQVPGLGLGSR